MMASTQLTEETNEDYLLEEFASDLRDAFEEDRIRRNRHTLTFWIVCLGVFFILGVMQCLGWNETRRNIWYCIVVISAMLACVPLCCYGSALYRLERDESIHAGYQELSQQELA